MCVSIYIYLLNNKYIYIHYILQSEWFPQQENHMVHLTITLWFGWSILSPWDQACVSSRNLPWITSFALLQDFFPPHAWQPSTTCKKALSAMACLWCMACRLVEPSVSKSAQPSATALAAHQVWTRQAPWCCSSDLHEAQANVSKPWSSPSHCLPATCLGSKWRIGNWMLSDGPIWGVP